MAEHRWSILCSNASVDSQSNNVSIFNVIDDVQIGGLPAGDPGSIPLPLPMPVTLVTNWRREDAKSGETLEAKVSLHDPKGGLLVETPTQRVDLTSFIQHRMFVTIPLFPLRGLGTYHFVVQSRSTPDQPWVVADRVPLTITDQPSASANKIPTTFPT